MRKPDRNKHSGVVVMGFENRFCRESGRIRFSVSPVWGAAFLLILLFCISFSLGRYPVSLGELCRILFSSLWGGECDVPPMVRSVVLKVRIPRVCSAVLIGGALSASGAVYQGLFRNPMVSPDILGASAGACFGAALAILLSLPFALVQFSAFVFGLVAVALSYVICALVSRGKESVLILVLAGIVIATLFSSLVSLGKYVADPFGKLPEITYWLMGGLSSITGRDAKLLLMPCMLGFLPLVLLRWQLNAMAFGDEEAQAMGLNTARLRIIFISAATLLTAASVAVGGMIGWVGLVIPHLSRMLAGADHRHLIPASFLIGGCFLLFVDNLARLFFTSEIPLGILTSLIGAPFFVYLLFRRRRGWV